MQEKEVLNKKATGAEAEVGEESEKVDELVQNVCHSENETSNASGGNKPEHVCSF